MFSKKSKITDLDFIYLSGLVYEIIDLFFAYINSDAFDDFESFFRQFIKLCDRYVSKLRSMR